MGKSHLLVILSLFTVQPVLAVPPQPASPEACLGKDLPGTLNSVSDSLNQGEFADPDQESCAYKKQQYDMSLNDYGVFNCTLKTISTALPAIDDHMFGPKPIYNKSQLKNNCPADSGLAAYMIKKNNFGKLPLDPKPGLGKELADQFKSHLDQTHNGDRSTKDRLDAIALNYAKLHKCENGVVVKSMKEESLEVTQDPKDDGNLEGWLDVYRTKLKNADERVGVFFNDTETEVAVRNYEARISKKIEEIKNTQKDFNQSKNKSYSTLLSRALVQNQEYADRLGYICTPPALHNTAEVGTIDSGSSDFTVKVFFGQNSNSIDEGDVIKFQQQINDNLNVAEMRGCQRKITKINVFGSSSKLRNTSGECSGFKFKCLSKKRADQVVNDVIYKLFPDVPKSVVGSNIISSDGTSGEVCPYEQVPGKTNVVRFKPEFAKPEGLSQFKAESSKDQFVTIEVHAEGTCPPKQVNGPSKVGYYSLCQVPQFQCK